MIRINLAPEGAIQKEEEAAGLRAVMQRTGERALELKDASVETLKSIKDRVLALGIPGLAAYNLLDGVIVGAVAYAAQNGDMNERLSGSGVAGGVAILTNASFYAMLAMIAMRVRRSLSPAMEPIETSERE